MENKASKTIIFITVILNSNQLVVNDFRLLFSSSWNIVFIFIAVVFISSVLEAAHIIESSNIFNVSHGDSITLRCRGGGNPAPTVSFLYIQNGDYITLRKGTSVMEFIIYVFKSQEIFCRVNNTIIQPLPCGQVKEFEDITNIKINI